MILHTSLANDMCKRDKSVADTVELALAKQSPYRIRCGGGNAPRFWPTRLAIQAEAATNWRAKELGNQTGCQSTGRIVAADDQNIQLSRWASASPSSDLRR